jgi:uncharacterized protein (DUF2345 family)
VCFPSDASADITSGGALDITSGGALDITSGGALDITSGGALDITSGGALDITSGGALDITSGGALDITSGGALDITSGGALDITSGGTLDITSGGQHLLSGPISTIDRPAGTFESLGQTVWVDQAMLGHLSVGDYVAVVGSVIGPGNIYADLIGEYGSSYVAGASEVLVVGIPSSVDSSIAELMLGKLPIDYSPTLANGAALGAPIIEFKGIQPEPGGKLISFSTKEHR